MRRWTLVLTMLAFAIDPAAAQRPLPPPVSVETPGVIYRIENWVVRRTIDRFTDETSCLINSLDNPNVEVVRDRFFLDFRGRGGVQSYRIRLDSSPPSRLALASEVERRAELIDLRSAFPRILRASRLRAEVMTYRGVVIEDIDLTLLSVAHARMVEECHSPRRSPSR